MKRKETRVAEIDGKWYAFEVCEEDNQVYSIGRDCPPRDPGSKNRQYCAKWSDAGIQSVATPSVSRAAARRKARRWELAHYDSRVNYKYTMVF